MREGERKGNRGERGRKETESGEGKSGMEERK